jgi:hypothetical protein
VRRAVLNDHSVCPTRVPASVGEGTHSSVAQLTVNGGDSFTALDGSRQTREFDKGLHINSGPWRVSHHHQGDQVRTIEQERHGQLC